MATSVEIPLRDTDEVSCDGLCLSFQSALKLFLQTKVVSCILNNAVFPLETG